jgi:predicted RecB family nuclease
MSACRRQAMIEAPVDSIWDLIGDPTRHPEWWPRMIEVDGERFEQGDEYVLVSRGPVGKGTTQFLVERLDELREIRIKCQVSGTYAHWLLTEARGGTFVDLEMGIQPKALPFKVFDKTMAPRYFRRWAEQSIEALGEAASGGDAEPVLADRGPETD